jgi:hypothetical protein
MQRIRLNHALLVNSAAVVGGLIGLATNAAYAQQEPAANLDSNRLTGDARRRGVGQPSHT